MPPQRRKKVHKSKRKGVGVGNAHKRLTMKHKTKDFDQIVEAVQKGEVQLTGDTSGRLAVDDTKPNDGQSYCGICDKYFINDDVLAKHKTQTPHKLRVKKVMKEKPWTVEDSRLPVDNGPRLRTTPLAGPN